MSILWIERSDGREFHFGEIYRLFSSGLTGVGQMDIDLYTTEKGVGDGEEVNGQRVQARTINVTAVAFHRAVNDPARRIANSFFLPTHDYILHFDYRGRQAWIAARLETFNLATENIHRPQQMGLTFRCPDPYFYGEDSHTVDIAMVRGRTGWPYMSHPEYGRLASVYDFNKLIDIYNEGDLPASPKVKIVASGEVKNPIITKDNLFVKLLDTLVQGDVVEVDFDENTVRKNGENILQKLSKDSNLVDIQLDVGENVMGYDAELGDNVMAVYVSYYDRYVGV